MPHHQTREECSPVEELRQNNSTVYGQDHSARVLLTSGQEELMLIQNFFLLSHMRLPFKSWHSHTIVRSILLTGRAGEEMIGYSQDVPLHRHKTAMS